MFYNFCHEQIESISAWELLPTIKLKPNESWFYPLKAVCLAHGVEEDLFHSLMDYEIMADDLITNPDRHMNNIALLRDPDSFQFKGLHQFMTQEMLCFTMYRMNSCFRSVLMM